MSKKLTRRVQNKHKIKVPDNRPLPEPAESMVASVLPHPVSHVQHEKHHILGSKISPFSMADVSRALATAGSSAVFSNSSEMSKTDSSSTSRSTYCSGYDSADDSSGTFIGLHDLGSDFGESGTSFMSWSDEVDMDTTTKLQNMYDSLERFLYDEGEFPSNLGSDLLEECLLWKETFTYIRPKLPESTRESPTLNDCQEVDCVYGDIAMGSKCEPSQEVLREKVTDQVVKNLSSHLLSNVIQSLAAGIDEIRTKSLEAQRARKASRSRSRSNSPRIKSKSNRMPALVHKTAINTRAQPRSTKNSRDQVVQVTPMQIHEEPPNFLRRSNSTIGLLDKCLGSSIQTLRPVSHLVPDIGSRVPPTNFIQSLPVRNLPILPLQLSDNLVSRSTISRAESYPATSDRKFSALNSVLAGRKSPRQEVILKNIQEERVKHSAKVERAVETKANVMKQQNHLPSKHKPPWIGYAHITLPPIDHGSEAKKEKVSRRSIGSSSFGNADVGKSKVSRRSSSDPRTRKVSPRPLASYAPSIGLSPLPLEVQGTALGRPHIARKVVENISQAETSAHSSLTRKGPK